MCQSTNDVFPSAGKIAVLKLLIKAQIQLQRLYKALSDKAEEFDDVLKMGRTQLQDAVPIRLGQEFRAYSEAIRRDIARLEHAQDEMRCLNMGGTAVGTGINADEMYLRRIVPNLSMVTGLQLVQAFNLVDATQNLDGFVAVSGAVKTCAVNLSKMCNDLRLMSSGPRCGFNEINLPAKQNGSSIMPGKVNPVIPEVVNQVAFNIMGNDFTITMAAEGGQLELNAFEPIIFWNLTHEVEFLTYAVNTLTDNCIVGITANRERCQSYVDHSVGIITALTPHIGYEHAADIAKEAIRTGASVKDLILQKGRVGEVDNVGGHNEMKIIDIVMLICKELGKPESLIHHVTDRKGHDRRYAIDPTKIHEELGWLPETKFADGIKKTIQWYLDHEDWWQPIISGEYQQYYQKMYGSRG